MNKIVLAEVPDYSVVAKIQEVSAPHGISVEFSTLFKGARDPDAEQNKFKVLFQDREKLRTFANFLLAYADNI